MPAPTTGVSSNHISKIADTKSGGRPMSGSMEHKKKKKQLMGGYKKERKSFTSHE